LSGLRDKPAYPGEQEIQIQDAPNIRYPVPGMTYREAAALHIMAGFATDPGWNEAPATNPAIPAALAVEWADALIAALEAQDATTPKEQ